MKNRKVGLVTGKFSPFHRGHLNLILDSATKCDILYVVISHNENLEKELYKDSKIHRMTLLEKERALAIELQDFDFIKVITLNETDYGIQNYPQGWKKWSTVVQEIVPEHIDVIFGSDVEYTPFYKEYFPDADYRLYDCDRKNLPISATMIRDNIIDNWDYTLASTREYFTKKILVTGTESCAKTTVTKMLAKMFNTSYALEEGRYYSAKYLGANENVFTSGDFFNICIEQKQLEKHAIRTSNRVCFFDTDNIVTQFYHDIYLGGEYAPIEAFNDPDYFDLVVVLTPDVEWVDDGLRWISDDTTRARNHKKLVKMYQDRGYGDKMVEISGNYSQRLEKVIDVVNRCLKGERI